MFTKIFTPILMKYWPCTIEEVRHNIQKEKRIIDTLEPVMNRHRLIFDEKVLKEDLRVFSGLDDTSGEPYKYSLFYQLTHLTKDRGCLKHDDRLDALAMAVSYWVDSMAKNEDDAVEAWKERQLQEELERFMSEGLMVMGDSKGNLKDTCWFTLS